MKNLPRLLTLSALLVLALSSPSSAQTASSFGLGVGLSSGALGDDELEVDLSPLSIFVPINLSGFRLEPEIGLFRSSFDSGNDFESSTTLLQLGTGIFALRPVSNTNIYYGGRVGITRQSVGGSGDDDEGRTNFFVGPATGAEYLFADTFSLGGEAQLVFTSFGKFDESDDSSLSVLRTRAVFFIRWYP